MFLKMRKTPSPTSGKTPFRLREKVFLKVFLQQKFYHVAKNTLPVQVLSTCSRKMWGKYPRQKFSGGIFVHEIATDFTQTMFRERGAEITNRPPISHDSSTNKQ